MEAVVLIVIFGALLVIAAALAGSRLRRSAPPPPAIPPWASFFTAEEFEKFLIAVNPYMPVVTEDKTVIELPITDLADACREKDPDQWDSAIRECVAAMLAGITSALPELGDFDSVRHLLSLQLAAADALPPHAIIERDDIPGLITYLVLDLPTATRAITPAEAAAWKRPMGELFDIALDNVRKTVHPEKEKILLFNNEIAFTITSPSPFTAASALLLHEQPDICGPHGCLLALPTRNILIARPIETAPDESTLLPLIWTAIRRFDEGPASLTSAIYWYHHKRFAAVTYEFDGHTLHVDVPTQLADLPPLQSGGQEPKVSG
jgi:hypothetical protein